MTEISSPMKKRDHTITLMKFFAALLITNSHFDALYPLSLTKLSTGGAIGDAFFFFCSGYTLFMGRIDSFWSWYKRRISRIYPTIIAFAVLTSAIFSTPITWKDIIFGGGWFVNCIMIYYALMFFVIKYAKHRTPIVFWLNVIPILLVYFASDRSSIFMYGNTYFKWIFFFNITLLGGMIGAFATSKPSKIVNHVTLLPIYCIAFYGIQMLGKIDTSLNNLQILSLIPLHGICISTYHIIRYYEPEIWLRKVRLFSFINFISMLTLEIYIVQYVLIKRNTNLSFPQNMAITILEIIAFAYLLKVASRLLSQIFDPNSNNWKAAFALSD